MTVNNDYVIDEELKNELNESEIEEQVTELQVNYEEDLVNFPQVIQHIGKLKKIIRKQQKKLNKFYTKLKDHRFRLIVHTTDATTQTDEIKEKDAKVYTKKISEPEVSYNDAQNSWSDVENITEEVKKVAEQAISTSGFAYEPTSGMYYDYKTGYYYNAELRMYYDGHSGRYLVYDEESQQYKYQEQATGSIKAVTDPETLQPDESVAILTKKMSRLEVDRVRRAALDVSSRWPPCLRLMVMESSVPGIAVGRLFLVTCEGGDVGREGEVPVLLPEPAVSKVHLNISYSDDTYRIVDLGSRNGTFLNSKRISAALQESDPVELDHGDILKVGSTCLAVHIHRGSDTCNGCEPGLLLQAEPPPPLPASLPMRDLKKKFGVNKTGQQSKKSDSYTDRALRRRAEVGSSHPAEKTETACVERAIGSENKGFKMLQKMGWSSGQKLGINDEGLSEPVPMVGNIGSVGLGATSLGVDTPGTQTKASKKKQQLLKITRSRYEQSPMKPPDDTDDGDNSIVDK